MKRTIKLFYLVIAPFLLTGSYAYSNTCVQLLTASSIKTQYSSLPNLSKMVELDRFSNSYGRAKVALDKLLKFSYFPEKLETFLAEGGDLDRLRSEASASIISLFKSDDNFKLATQSQLESVAKYAVENVMRPVISFRVISYATYRLNLLLQGIDPDQKPQSLSSLLQLFEVVYILDTTSMNNLSAIFKSGLLRARNKTSADELFGGSSEYFYTEIAYSDVTRARIDQKTMDRVNNVYIKNTRAEIAISLEALDQVPISHFSTSMDFGKKAQNSFDITNMIGAYFWLNKSDFHDNELLFIGDIDVKRYVEGIFVNPENLESTQNLIETMSDGSLSPELINRQLNFN